MCHFRVNVGYSQPNNNNNNCKSQHWKQLQPLWFTQTLWINMFFCVTKQSLKFSIFVSHSQTNTKLCKNEQLRNRNKNCRDADKTLL